MATRTKSTRAAKKVPVQKTVRDIPVAQELHPHSITDTESPTASQVARDIFKQHALFAARMRERSRHAHGPSHITSFMLPQRFFNAHASFAIENQHEAPHTRKSPLQFLFTLSLGTRFLLIAIILGASIAIYPRLIPKNPVTSTIENVRALVIGIADEEPTIYSVTDPQKIAGQGPLFKKLIAGDTILHYRNAELVVFYRSSEEKIIAVMSTTE